MNRRKRMLDDLNQDIRDHIERETQDNIDRGMSPEDARHAALRKFGNMTRVQEETREVWSFVWLEQVPQDIRYGVRMLWKNRGVFGIAVITLALGIGLNTTIFSAVNAILLRPLPVPKSSQIVTLFPEEKVYSRRGFSAADFKDMERETKDSFSGLIGCLSKTDVITVDGKTDHIETLYVTGNFFSTLGIKPALGRFILPDEGNVAGADPIIVFSYDYWKTRLGSDPAIVGKKVVVNRRFVTIVGIAPAGFYGSDTLFPGQGYLPLGMAANGSSPKDFLTDRGSHYMHVQARLRPDVSLEQANASLAVIFHRLSQTYPEAHKDLIGIKAFPELQARLDAEFSHEAHTVSELFLGLAAVLLLLACANVANILLVRATLREREMAIRAALGAARARLIRQLLTESIVLALFGGVLGIFLGEWACSWLSSTPIEIDIPLQFDFSFDWRVFAYAFSAALLTGIIVGLIPAFRGSRRNLNTILHQGGRGVVGGKNVFRSTLIVAQVGGSLTLLIIAGLFTHSLAKAQQTNLGFNPNHVLNLTMNLKEIGYSEAQGLEFYKNLLDRVRALPGVQSASIAEAVPLSVYNYETLTMDDQKPLDANENVVSPDYFKTMEIPILRGREFTAADDSDAEYTAVINESLAKQFWPNTDPLGKQFQIASDPKHLFRVIGIAKDSGVNYETLTGTIEPYFCLPISQNNSRNTKTLQLRTSILPEAMIPTVESLIQKMAPDLPLTSVQTMSQSLNSVAGYLWYEIGAVVAAVFGILGLILAVVGVYGVISYTSSQRTREIGIRLALGAQPREILKMIFRQGLTVVAIGLTIGIGVALVLARVVGNFLIISPMDPITYLSASVILTIVALVACYVPARRAMRVDPMVALRHE